MPTLRAWLSAFAFTQAVEVPLYVAAFQKSALPRKTERSIGELALLGFGASLITHPFVWFFIPQVPSHSYVEMVTRAESFAVVVEAFYLFVLGAFDLKRSLLLSFAINFASASLGLLSRYFLGWP